MTGEPVPAEPAPRRIKTYDFRKPDKFSKDQIRTVAILHETFARQSTTALSSQLRCLVHVHVASVDQLTYEEFIRSIPNPCTLAVIAMEPLKGAAVLEIDPSVAFAMLDRLFGGDGAASGLRREITDIESSVMEGLVVRLLGNLREAWASMIDLRPRLAQIETNPQFAQIVPPSEMIVLVTLHTRVGEVEGMMNLCLPYLTIEPLVPRLSAQFIYSSFRRGMRREARRVLLDHMSDLGIPAEICVPGVRLSLREIGALRKGSRVPLHAAGPQDAYLRMGGSSLFRLKARPGGRWRPLVYGVVDPPRGSMPAEPQPLERKEGAADLQDAIHAAIDGVASRMDARLAELKGGVEELKRKQSALADELAFSPPEARAADAGAERLRPFSFVRRADPVHFRSLLQQEHPQLIALVLSYLEPQRASAVLGGLPRDAQPDVARRIASLGQTSPEVVREVERVLEHKLAVISSDDFVTAGGVESLVEILSVADRSTEKNVVEALETRDPKLAEEVKRSMFVFEDILALDAPSVARVLQRLDTDDVLRAMKAAPEPVQALLWKHVPAGDVQMLRRRFEEMGRVRLSDVEKAQSRIVSVIREMDENGEIVAPRAGDAVG